MSFKEILLKEGWAGKTLSRPETVERVNPVIRSHTALNHAYAYAIRHLQDREIADRLNAFQRRARMDIGKLAETVFSAGGAAYNGIDMEPDDVRMPDGDDEILYRLVDQEQEFRALLALELTQEHQIRTRAILRAVEINVLERQSYLGDVTRRRPRPHGSTLPTLPDV
jgi:hypothetical protein